MISGSVWQSHQQDQLRTAPTNRIKKNTHYNQMKPMAKHNCINNIYEKSSTYFKILFTKFLQEGCVLSTCHTVSNNVIDILLFRFHILNIFVQADKFILTLGREKSKQWSKPLVVFTVFNATQFQVFAEVLPELVIVLEQMEDM